MLAVLNVEFCPECGEPLKWMNWEKETQKNVGDGSSRVMKFAYADPPYLGQGKRYKEKAEVDYKTLISRLVQEFPDGWALSCSSPSLQTLLTLCPQDVRILAWVKPFCIFKPGVGLAYAWEPVIFRGGRKITRKQPTVRDWVSCNITLKKGLVGAKPREFCSWLVKVFNAMPGDTLEDLFPGTGIVSKVWREEIEQKGGA